MVSKRDSSNSKVCGERVEELERMNRTVGFFDRSENDRINLCMVGVAEYHVAP